MKATETREETLARLAKDALKGVKAAKRFKALVKRVANTPSQSAKAKSTELAEA
jgi:hypothetical protein